LSSFSPATVCVSLSRVCGLKLLEYAALSF